MSGTRPGILAVRAVNQYRRRDVVSYLGLRYYLENAAARSDQWAREVATDLVLRRSGPGYFKSLHFKDADSDGISHREMFFPGANEALAEAALIDACSEAGIRPSAQIFSYRPVSRDDRSGVFEHYMVGLKERHSAITAACRSRTDAQVSFLDIRRFYPSIKVELAASRWRTVTEKSSLPARFRELGLKLLADYAVETASSGKHLLTGPMFSHLMGNVFLSELDEAMIFDGGARYFRYVDDIALVGSREEIRRSQALLLKMLEQVGLELHDELSAKTLTISAMDWLSSSSLGEEAEKQTSWMSFVGSLKQLLIYQPELAQEMSERFASRGFRIPVPDYSSAVRESGFVERFLSRTREKWFRLRVSKHSAETLVNEAQALRIRYKTELSDLFERLGSSSRFLSKSLIPHVRYRMGRLAYLASNEELAELAQEGRKQPALFFQSAVASAVASGRVDEIIKMGGNASQAVAQPLRMAGNKVIYSASAKSDVERQALAVFALNGVRVNLSELDEMDDLVRFAARGVDRRLMFTSDTFLRELACLHGISGESRHADVLDSAFDEAEEIALDAVDQARLSMSL